MQKQVRIAIVCVESSARFYRMAVDLETGLTRQMSADARQSSSADFDCAVRVPREFERRASERVRGCRRHRPLARPPLVEPFSHCRSPPPLVRPPLPPAAACLSNRRSTNRQLATATATIDCQSWRRRAAHLFFVTLPFRERRRLSRSRARSARRLIGGVTQVGERATRPRDQKSARCRNRYDRQPSSGMRAGGRAAAAIWRNVAAPPSCVKWRVSGGGGECSIARQLSRSRSPARSLTRNLIKMKELEFASKL